MEKKVKSIILSSPIERVRGGEILVSVNIVFEDNSQFSGFSVSQSEKLEDLKVARNEAIQDALTLSGVEVNQVQISTLVDILKDQSVLITEPELQARFEAGSINQEHLDQLKDPTDANKQNDLNNLCDVLGLPRIDAGNWTLLEAIAVISALRKRVKKLEAK